VRTCAEPKWRLTVSALFKQEALPSDEQLGSLLGIENFRDGTHVIRAYPAHGEPLGEVNVRYFWKAIIIPSHAPQMVLCASAAEGKRYNTTPANENLDAPALKGWQTLILATSSESVLMRFREDSVADLMAVFDLLPFDDRFWCGTVGISYEISFGTNGIRGSFGFRNPTYGQLKKLESVLLSTAKLVAMSSKKKVFRNAVEQWEKYTK